MIVSLIFVEKVLIAMKIDVFFFFFLDAQLIYALVQCTGN